MLKHNFAGLFTSSKRNSVNSIHPEITNIDGPSTKETQVVLSRNKHAFRDDLFSSKIIRCSKSFIINVRGDRLIHIQQYVPKVNDSYHLDSKQECKQEESPIVLFFIHGVGGSWKVWDSQIQNFVQEGYEDHCIRFIRTWIEFNTQWI